MEDYKQNLETQLYDLPPSKLAESISNGGRYVASSYRRGTSTSGAIEEKIKQMRAKGAHKVSECAAMKDDGEVEVEKEGAEMHGNTAVISQENESAVAVTNVTPKHSPSEGHSPTSNQVPLGSPSHQSSDSSPEKSSRLPSTQPLCPEAGATVGEDNGSESGYGVTKHTSLLPSAADQVKLLTEASWGRHAREGGTGGEDRGCVGSQPGGQAKQETLALEAEALLREKWKQDGADAT